MSTIIDTVQIKFHYIERQLFSMHVLVKCLSLEHPSQLKLTNDFFACKQEACNMPKAENTIMSYIQENTTCNLLNYISNITLITIDYIEEKK